jgi:SAM-dependent methyltransferase
VGNKLDSVQYSRAVYCNNLRYLGTTDIEQFLKIAKDDWNIRADVDASSYVCASPQASEAQIEASGYEDVRREFVHRAFPFEVGWYDDDFCAKVGSILEIGCGFGRMSRFLMQYCEFLYAMDISSALIAKAKERIPTGHVVFFENNGMTIPDEWVPDNSIDLAFEYIVFQHIPVPEIVISYIKEVHRKLKVGGRFIMHGRDVPADEGGASMGNTWHGCQCGTALVKKAIEDTTFVVVKEEGVGTDRYWATLEKKGGEV